MKITVQTNAKKKSEIVKNTVRNFKRNFNEFELMGEYLDTLTNTQYLNFTVDGHKIIDCTVNLVFVNDVLYFAHVEMIVKTPTAFYEIAFDRGETELTNIKTRKYM